MIDRPLRIASRGSPLARFQAEAVRDALRAAHGGPAPEIVFVRTSGDAITDRPLRDVGGKGLFTKEIEEALLSGAADLAVHSAKDMPTQSRRGLMLAAVLPREDPRDVLISRGGQTLKDLPHGARVGTASLRRQAQLRRARPDLIVSDMRGNIETRLAKLEEGAFDAIVLAAAGLARLGLKPPGLVVLSTTEMLPAAAQGAIGIEIRAQDEALAARLQAINHAPTFLAVQAERAFLAVLDGSCHSPIGGHMTIVDGRADMRGLVLSPDGREAYSGDYAAAAEDAVNIGRAVADEIRAKMPDAFVDAYLQEH